MKWLKRYVVTFALAIVGGVASATGQALSPQQPADVNLKPMASDATPSFEVATIKRSDPAHPAEDAPFGHRTVMGGTTVRFLLAFIYNVHDKQIIGAPDWLATEKFDFDGVADTPGTPNIKQIQTMFQKLLAERLQLKFHHEQRELSAYVLTVAKNGEKLTKDTGDVNVLPSLMGRPSLGMQGRNLTMADFAARLQSGIVDRPVVDRTGLQGRYDFTLKWTPDESQFTQVNAHVAPPSETADAPGLFTAMQEQLGLKLVAEKAVVDVLVIDHVERPSAN